MTTRTAALLAAAVFLPAPAVAHSDKLTLRHESIELPGPPVKTIAVDLNGDGRRDLVFVVDYTDWGSVATSHVEKGSTTLDVIPALEEVRELHAFLANAQGHYFESGDPLILPQNVFDVERGPEGLPLIALADDGLWAIALVTTNGKSSLSLRQLAADHAALQGSGAFLPNLHLVSDLDHDGIPDVLFPAQEGLALYRGKAGGLEETARWRQAMASDRRQSGDVARRFFPLPVPIHGKERTDLLVRGRDDHDKPVVDILAGNEHGFGPPARLKFPWEVEGEEHAELAFVGDLGDGRVSLVTRQVKKESKRDDFAPASTLRFYRVGPEMKVEEKPWQTLDTVGFSEEGESGDALGGFRDLDGDGRLDFVSVSFEFSKWQMLRVVATAHASLGVNFHIYHQEPDGSFRAVKDDLSEKLALDLNDLHLDQVDPFEADFDGDGRLDYVQLGPGRTIEIHRGHEGARYEKKPDLEIELPVEPQDYRQLEMADLDGDGRADLAFRRLLPPAEATLTGKVRVDLYLSGEVR